MAAKNSLWLLQGIFQQFTHLDDCQIKNQSGHHQKASQCGNHCGHTAYPPLYSGGLHA